MHKSLRCALLAATSLSIAGLASPAFAQSAADASASGPVTSEGYLDGTSSEEPGIVVRDGFSTSAPPPTGIWSPVNINGVGQVVTDAGGGSVGTCTGTLINPRTVIFAAHCVNNQAPDTYGGNTGGTGISVGFQQYNLLALRQWLGLDGGTRYATIEGQALYNVEQVWWDPRSREAISCTNATSCFLQGDVAIATLDTPATDIPTWAMLFSPLTEQTHVTVTGYGSTGTHSSIMAAGTSASGAWRRRAAENLVSALGSMQDRNAWLYGSISGAAPQMVYMVSLTDPNPAYNSSNAVRKYDFGIFGAGDVALPVEGMGAPGDSGGPLIADQNYAMPVVIGVLSGSSRFFTNQPSNTYGTHSFYQPLYAFWETIVANNPYVYASALGGNGEWTDGSHWVQDMDPSYMIDVGGSLVNSLPDTHEIGTVRTGETFGQICFLTDCVTLSGDAATGDGSYIVVPGGPGSTNFVPDNVVAKPAQGVKSRYYDVALYRAGTTRLSNASATVDVLSIDGAAKLDVARTGSLKALGDFTQYSGWTNVDGLLSTGEALMVSGILTGTGTLRAPWLTTAAVYIAPAGADAIGTLTVDGNMIVASGSALYIDANRTGADKLAVTGSLALSASESEVGPSLVFNKGPGAAPRQGDKWDIVSAAGGLTGTFGNIYSFQGVLRPELTYSATGVSALLRAGSFVTILEGQNPTALAFANALDALRANSYNALYNLYGSIDLMGASQLIETFSRLSPAVAGESRDLMDNQHRTLLSNVTGRLSAMSNGRAQGLSFSGDARALTNDGRTDRTFAFGFSGLAPSAGNSIELGEGVSGFVSAGLLSGESGYGDSASLGVGQQGSYTAMGLEFGLSDRLSVGTAVGYADGQARPGSDLAQSKMTQAAAYASYAMGLGAYLGAVALAETARSEMSRATGNGEQVFSLSGSRAMQRFGLTVEAGREFALGGDMRFTPRARLGYDRMALGGYQEFGSDAALAIDSVAIKRLEARIGFTAGGGQAIGDGWSLRPTLEADYVRMAGDGNEGLDVRFAAAPDVGFVLPLADGADAWGEAKGGIMVSNGTVQFGAGFEATTTKVVGRTNRAMVDFGVKF